MTLLFVYLSDLSQSDIIKGTVLVGTVARLHACLYTISSSAWRIFRVFNPLSVARCPHLPAAVRESPFIGGHLTGLTTVTPHSLFFGLLISN